MIGCVSNVETKFGISGVKLDTSWLCFTSHLGVFMRRNIRCAMHNVNYHTIAQTPMMSPIGFLKPAFKAFPA